MHLSGIMTAMNDVVIDVIASIIGMSVAVIARGIARVIAASTVDMITIVIMGAITDTIMIVVTITDTVIIVGIIDMTDITVATLAGITAAITMVIMDTTAASISAVTV